METKTVLDPRYRELLNGFAEKHRTGVLTLFFSDMVGSTKIKQDLGDTAGKRKGVAKTIFEGKSGIYNIILLIVPENDGEPIVKMYVKNKNIYENKYPCDKKYYKTSDILKCHINGVKVCNGDEVRIEGFKDKGAFARLDAIEFKLMEN